MIRREGHDPQHYTISRRGKKLAGTQPSGGVCSPRPRTTLWENGPAAIKRTMVQDHDYEDNVGILYRSEEESPNEYESSSPSEEETRQSQVPWRSVIVCRYGNEKENVTHPAERG